jgi:hypothetical protein
VPAFERELRLRVLLYREGGGPETVLVVTACAVRSEAPAVHVTMAVGAFIELEASESSLPRELWRVTTLARDSSVGSFEWENRQWMRSKTDLSGKPQPPNARMTVLAAIPESCFMDPRVT